MNRPQGRIIELYREAAPPRAVVEVVAAARCPRCAAGRGCGAGLLEGESTPRRVDALLPGNLEVHRGDRVWLELAPEDLLQAALLAYGTPLLTMLLAAGGAYLAGLGDLQAVVATLLGAGIGMGIARLRLRRGQCLQNMTPRVAGRCSAAAGQ
jgi:sigma-E factor negative regulatory protein RseC